MNRINPIKRVSSGPLLLLLFFGVHATPLFAGIGDRFREALDSGLESTKVLMQQGQERMIELQQEDRQDPLMCPTFKPGKPINSKPNSYLGTVQSIKQHIDEKNRDQAKLEAAKALIRFRDWPKIIDQSIGDQQHQKLVKQGWVQTADTMSARVARKHAQAEKLLQQLLQELPSDVAQQFKFQVFFRATPGSVLDANALPNGNIYINESLMRNRQLAHFVLSHELSHVLKRHTGRAYKDKVLEVVETVEELDELREIVKEDRERATVLLKYLSRLQDYWVSYDPKQEQQADSCAVRLLANLQGVDPKLATDQFINNLQEVSNLTDDRSHPDYQARAQHISLVLQEAAKAY